MGRGVLLKPGASFCPSELFGGTRVICVATIRVSLPIFLLLMMSNSKMAEANKQGAVTHTFCV
jgi:hypothetical protein